MPHSVASFYHTLERSIPLISFDMVTGLPVAENIAGWRNGLAVATPDGNEAIPWFIP